MINEVIQIFYDQFVLVQIIQSSPIPQISNLLKTFLEAEYFEVVLIVFTMVLATVQGRQSGFFPGQAAIVATTSPTRHLCQCHFLFFKIQPPAG